MPSHPHCHWRDLQEMRRIGLELSTTSDDACKMFDAILTQYVSYTDDNTIGGVSGCVERMQQADPEFIMGTVIKIGVGGKTAQSDKDVADEATRLMDLSKKIRISPWEQQHVDAILLKSRGYSQAACAIWEDILVEYPHDMLSLKLLYDARAYEGNSIARRDCCARVLPSWSRDMPLYGDLLSMYAFGLEETNFYADAERIASEACDMIPSCTWAHHCIAHCKEMTGRTGEGKAYMMKTENMWRSSKIACHCYWHWALFHYEDGENDSALNILRDCMASCPKQSKGMPWVTDVSSLCFRLESEGVNVKDFLKDCHEISQSHVNDRIWAFWDVHGVLSSVRAAQKEIAGKMIDEARGYIRNGEGDIRDIYDDVAVPVMEAFEAYGEGQYESAIDIMKPLRYKLHRVGASWAQRDIFNLFIIYAGLRSYKPKYRKYAQQLLYERQSSRGKTKLMTGLLTKVADTIE